MNNCRSFKNQPCIEPKLSEMKRGTGSYTVEAVVGSQVNSPKLLDNEILE